MNFLAVLLIGVALLPVAGSAGEEAVALSPEQTQFRELLRLGQSADAEDLEKQLLEKVAERRGRRSLEFADELDALVEIRVDTGNLAGRTLELAQQAVALRSDLQGQNTPDLIPALDTLAYLLHVDGALEAARDAYRWSFDLRQQHFGLVSREAAIGLAGLASVEADLGEQQRGEELMRRSLAILEELYGPDDPRIATGLFRLALLLYDQERFEEAIAIWSRTLEMFERPESRDEEQLARSHHNLGEAHYRLGHIELAFEYLERALRLRLRLDQPGEPPMPQYPSTYSSLADLARDVGELARAREYYLAALDGLRSWGGEDPFRYAETLSRLGLLDAQSGSWDDALEHQQRALEIRRSKLGPQDPLVASVLQRLGSLHLQMGDFESASERLGEALAIQGASSGAVPSALAATLESLAALAERQERADTAFDYSERALAALEALGESHPAKVESLARLARMRRREGHLDETSKLAREALNIAVVAFGEESPRTLAPGRELALVEALNGDDEEAHRSALRLEAIRRDHVQATIRSFPERQALLFAESEGPALDLALTVLDRAGPAAPTRVAEVWDSVVRSRGLVFDAIASRQRLLAARADPQLERLAEQLREAHARLAALMVRGSGNLPMPAYVELVRSIRRQVTAAERALARASRPFLEEARRDARGLDEVIAALPEKAALVAVVRYRHFERELPGVTGDGARYGVFVHSELSEGPHFVPLGGASEIDTAVTTWMRSTEWGLSGEKGAEEQFRVLGVEVRRRVWEPLESHLRGVDRVFLVPEGSIHLMNAAALPGRDPHRYAIEEEGPSVHLLTTERDLVEDRDRLATGTGLLAMGGADFLSEGALAGSEIASTEAVGTLRALGLSACRPLEAQSFAPLPGTLEEVEEVTGLWRSAMATGTRTEDGEPVILLTGARATEAAFKSLAPGKRALHLATHGFFLEEGCELPRADSAEESRRGSWVDSSTLSALVLAGANRRSEVEVGQEDGLLTALEVSGLDLSGVQWAVLSACDTGLGRIGSTEGVFGLRRALLLAGVRTVIMSLWKVEDAPTRDWMRRFYSRRFEHRDDTAAAVRRASMEVLEARRSAGLSTHPAFWAAFVAAGDWR